MPTPLDNLRAFTQDVKQDISQGFNSIMEPSPIEGVPPEVAKIFQLIKSQNPDIPNEQAMQMAMDSLKSVKHHQEPYDWDQFQFADSPPAQEENIQQAKQIIPSKYPQPIGINNPMARHLQKYGGSDAAIARSAAISSDAYDRLMSEYGDAGASAGAFTGESIVKNKSEAERIKRLINRMRMEEIRQQQLNNQPSPMGFIKSLMD